MKKFGLGIVWLLVLMSVAVSVNARTPRKGKGGIASLDRPLLASARYYTPISRPWDHSYYHIYRFNPDGSGKTQLTFQHQNDVAACWSPNGKHIAFARRYASADSLEGDSQICIQSVYPHAKARVILRLHNAYVDKITWSGDGKCLAVGAYRDIWFVTPRGFVLRQMKTDWKGFPLFAPDGKHYAVYTADGTHYIVDTLRGTKLRIDDAGVWWDSKTFLRWNDTANREAGQATNLPMTFVDLMGKTIRQIALRPTALQHKYFQSEYNEVVPIWDAARVDPKSERLYIGFGKPQEQLFADMRTGEIRRWQGQDTGVYMMQLSPDGAYAYSLRGFKDVAPYGKHKDGRDRFVSVNTLQVTNMQQPNHFKDIVKGIVDVDSADWRR